MKTLLQINSSLHSGSGQSSLLARQFVDKWQQSNPEGRVIVRDLATSPVPHLTTERFQAFLTSPEERSIQQSEFALESDELIRELEQADIVVIGVPMYNFGIPSTLKAWIDHVARAGKTFKYTASGSVGLLADRPTFIFAARGGVYLNTALETQTPYLTQFLNFVGIKNIKFIYAEGLAMGEASRSKSLEVASQSIEKIAA